MKPKSLKCGKCKKEIKVLTADDFGDEISWKTPWEQYLCQECYDAIWEAKLDNACGVCNTHPCERGRECWVNPWPDIMYLCYVAPRKNAIKNHSHGFSKLHESAAMPCGSPETGSSPLLTGE